MKYIKIKGKDYKDVMSLLRKEYGDDAIPISHKYVKEGGLFKSNLFGKQVCELTAGVQERKGLKKLAEEHRKIDFTVGDSSSDSGLSGSLPGKQKKSPVASGSDRARHLQRSIDDINVLLKGGIDEDIVVDAPLYSPRGKHVPPQVAEMKKEPASTSLGGEPMDRYEREFEEIRTALTMLLDKSVSVDEDGGDDTLASMKKVLEKNDFEPGESERIIGSVRKGIGSGDLNNRYSIEKSFKDLIKSRIVTTGPFPVDGRKKVIMLIGPTGVGKTTTMAKLGALYALRENKKVSFITIDNYRIAATEQLKKYAEIMGIQVHAITDREEFKEVINREKSDIILVDTSGRSHRNEVKIAEIRSFAAAVDYDIHKVLCVSATTKRSDLDDVFRAFEILDVDSVIITKVDETSFVGNVVNVADKYHKPISYVTNGQEVPNDIEVATGESLVGLMLGDGIIG